MVVASDVALLWWLGSLNPKGYGDFNPKELFGNGWIHPSIWIQLVCSLTSVELVFLCLILWYFRFVEICRCQGFKAASFSGTSYPSQFCDWDRNVMLERAIMPATLLRGLLVRGSWYRVGGWSIRQFRTWLIIWTLTLHIFLKSGFIPVRRFARLRSWGMFVC